MIVLDTTVLAYAVGSEHRFQGPCMRLMEAIEAGSLSATTTPEVIQEFAHIRARRAARQNAIELATAFADLLAPLIAVEETALRRGLALYGDHHGIGSFDAVLLAAAMDTGATAIASADAAFGAVGGIRHVVPDDVGVSALLG